MFKSFIRVFILSFILVSGSVFPLSANAATIDTGESTNKLSVIHHYMKKMFINFNGEWQSLNHKEYDPNAHTATNQEDEKVSNNVQSSEQETITKNDEQQQSSDKQLNNFEQKVVELTNNERVKNGLSPLEIDEQLSHVARDKSKDMKQNNYFDHQSPTYGSPFDMIQSYGIQYQSAGENIAKGQSSPEEVVNAWMNSPGHRANILNESFTHIGVGYVEQGDHWTQMFIGK